MMTSSVLYYKYTKTIMDKMNKNNEALYTYAHLHMSKYIAQHS